VGFLRLCVLFEVCSLAFDAKGPHSEVDIYNGDSGSWTTAQLSSARYDLAAASLPEQSLALFAGGYDGNGARGLPVSRLFSFSPNYSDYSAVVDIFNAATGQWTTTLLSKARSQLAAASLPAQGLALFAGGTSSSGEMLLVLTSAGCRFVQFCPFEAFFPEYSKQRFSCLQIKYSPMSIFSMLPLESKVSLF
jgi:hypothetical protein